MLYRLFRQLIDLEHVVFDLFPVEFIRVQAKGFAFSLILGIRLNDNRA